MKVGLFYFGSLGKGDPEAYEAGNIGLDPSQYRYLLEDVKAHCQLAEDLGFYGVYFAEHHFDVEGFESVHNPLLMDAWVAMNTRKLKVGQLGLVLPSWHPLRLAEDIATLTHLFGDRLELGFARGFQSREVVPLASAHQVSSALSDMGEADQRNRRLFQENYDILMKALRGGLFHHHGEFNKIPPPDLQWMNPATAKYGSGVDESFNVTDLGLVPQVNGGKMPLRWQAFSFSPSTMEWAAKEGMNLAMFEIKPDAQRQYQEVFRDGAEAAGRNLAYGEGVGYVRGMMCLEDGAQARAVDEAACAKVWGEWFSGTGFTEAFRLPGVDPELDPLDPTTYLSYSYDLIRDRGYTFSGTPDEVTRGIEALLENTSTEFLFLQVNTGAAPRDVILRSMETFAEQVLPRFDFEPLPDPDDVGLWDAAPAVVR